MYPRYDPYIDASAARWGVDPNMIRAMMRQESGGRPNAMSRVGASGLMQLMPATARGLGVKDIWDPAQNIDAGTHYYAQQLRKFGSPQLALAAYNAGPNAVSKYKGIPPYKETQNYVKKIMGNYRGLSDMQPKQANVTPVPEMAMAPAPQVQQPVIQQTPPAQILQGKKAEKPKKQSGGAGDMLSGLAGLLGGGAGSAAGGALAGPIGALAMNALGKIGSGSSPNQGMKTNMAQGGMASAGGIPGYIPADDAQKALLGLMAFSRM